MTRTFCVEISASTENIWMQFPLPGAEDIRIMTKYSTVDDPGKPPGPSVAFATSVWLPASPKLVFNFLRHENFRNKVCSVSCIYIYIGSTLAFWFLGSIYIYMFC
jgi:homeobox-leucine zipper protein